MKRVMVVMSVLFVWIGACSDSKSSSSTKGDGPTFAGLLGAVPDTADTRARPVFYSNLRSLRDGERPKTFEDDVRLLFDKSSTRLFLPDAVGTGMLEPDFARYAGFDTRQIEASLEFGELPDNVAVLVGTMKAGEIRKGLAASPGGDQLVENSVDGVTYLSLGDDGGDFGSVSPIRRIGQPLRMAIMGDTLYWGRTTPSVEACIAAAGDAAPSLGDDSNYSAVAGALDKGGIVNGVLVAPAGGESWTLAGLGETFQGETSTVTIALQYATPAMAASAATAFKAHVENDQSLATARPWSAVLTVSAAAADGSLMIATLTSTKPGISSTVVVQQDNLLQF
ncbi:MAG: hypothetical protein WCC60_02770 [Ilumatobacteraceae bacterium]